MHRRSKSDKRLVCWLFVLLLLCAAFVPLLQPDNRSPVADGVQVARDSAGQFAAEIRSVPPVPTFPHAKTAPLRLLTLLLACSLLVLLPAHLLHFSVPLMLRKLLLMPIKYTSTFIVSRESLR